MQKLTSVFPMFFDYHEVALSSFKNKGKCRHVGISEKL